MATRNYTVSSSTITNTGSGATYATLAAAKTGDSWGSGDTINLSPGSYLTGSLLLNAAVTINCSGCTLSHASSGAVQSEPLRITASNVRIIGPFNVADTGTRGTVLSIGAYVGGDTLAADVTGIYVFGMTATQCLPNSGTNPISINQDTATPASIECTLERCTFELGNGYRDIVGIAGDLATKRGQFVIKDCRFAGGTGIAGAYSGTNGIISCDASGDYWIVGCVLHDAGGDCVEMVASFKSRVYVYGCEVYNCSLAAIIANGGTGESSGTVGIRASWIENCYVHDCPSCVCLAENNAEANDFAVMRNCLLVTSATRGISETDMADWNAAVKVRARTSLIENCIIREGKAGGVASATTGSKLRRGISDVGTAGQSVTIRNCWVDGFHRAIYIGADSAWCDVDSCLITSSPANPGTGFSGQNAAIHMEGADAAKFIGLRVTNSIIAWTPAAAAATNLGYVVYMDGTAGKHDDQSGYNFWFYNANCNTLSGGNWTADSTDKDTTTAANAPVYDANGRQIPGSPAYHWGKLDAHGASNINASRIGSDTSTGAGSVTSIVTTALDGTGGADWFKNQTIVFMGNVTAGIKGQFRRISASSNANPTTLTITPALTAASANLDRFVILPPCWPVSGDMSRFGYSRIGLGLTGYAEPRDMFGRIHAPVYDSTLAAGTLAGRIAPGPLADLPEKADLRRGVGNQGLSRGRRMRLDDLIPLAR